MRRLPPLAALRSFEAAARHLSFKRAAAELAVTPTAISHQIRLLEESLGQKLFERRTRQVVLTDAGHLLFRPLQDGFDAFALAIERVHALNKRGRITLTAPMAFTSKWIVPRVEAFRSRFPGINLRLLASDDLIDLQSGEADIAVRYGGGVYPGCRAERLLREMFMPVCSPVLEIRSEDDLGAHPLLHTEWRHPDERTPSWPRWHSEAGIPLHLGDQLVFTDETHAIQAALAGQGIALAGMTLVADELTSGTLVVPFGPALEGHYFHIVTANAATDRKNIGPVREWLASEAAAFIERSGS